MNVVWGCYKVLLIASGCAQRKVYLWIEDWTWPCKEEAALAWEKLEAMWRLAICQALKTLLEYLRILYGISSISHLHCNSDYSWFHASWHRFRKHVSYMSSLRLMFFIDRKLPSKESSLWSCTKETCLLNTMTGGMLVDRPFTLVACQRFWICYSCGSNRSASEDLFRAHYHSESWMQHGGKQHSGSSDVICITPRWQFLYILAAPRTHKQRSQTGSQNRGKLGEVLIDIRMRKEPASVAFPSLVWPWQPKCEETLCYMHSENCAYEVSM